MAQPLNFVVVPDRSDCAIPVWMWASRERRAGKEDRRLDREGQPNSLYVSKNGYGFGFACQSRFDGAVIAALRALFFLSRDAVGSRVCHCLHCGGGD
jgi:hypothetical protein